MPNWWIPVGALCVLVALVLRLITAAKELVRKHKELNVADRQLALYTRQTADVRDGPEAQMALEQAALSRSIYRSVAVEYNRCVSKLVNRPIARLLHYQPVNPGREDA